MPLPPTAKAVPLLSVATPVNPAVPVAETTLKLVPFHCSTRSPSPTMKTSLGEEPETAVNWPVQVATSVQAVPLKFQTAAPVPPAPPTVQTSVAEIASTDSVPVGPLATALHVVPLNCRVEAPGCSPSPTEPTAKMALALAAEMLTRLPIARVRDATTLQLVPLKCSMSWLLAAPPTAQTSVGETTATELSPPAGQRGVVWILQDVPLKNSTSGVVVSSPLLFSVTLSPTAQTALLDAVLTELSVVEVAPAGLAWRPRTSSSR